MGCLRVVCWFVLCVVRGFGLFVVSGGCFLLGLLLGRGKEGECKGVSFGFSRGCSNRVFDGVLSVFEGACTGCLVVCLGVGSEDKGNGVSLGCSNWDFLTGIIPVGGIAGVVAPGLVCGAVGGGVGVWED